MTYSSSRRAYSLGHLPIHQASSERELAIREHSPCLGDIQSRLSWYYHTLSQLPMMLHHYRVSLWTHRGEMGIYIRDDFLGELGFGFLIVGIDVPTCQPHVWREKRAHLTRA